MESTQDWEAKIHYQLQKASFSIPIKRQSQTDEGRDSVQFLFWLNCIRKHGDILTSLEESLPASYQKHQLALSRVLPPPLSLCSGQWDEDVTRKNPHTQKTRSIQDELPTSVPHEVRNNFSR